MAVSPEMMRSVLEEWPSGLQLKEVFPEFAEIVGVEHNIELFFDGRIKDFECALIEYLLLGPLLVGLYSQALCDSQPRLVHGLLDIPNIWTLLVRAVAFFLLRRHDEAAVALFFLEPQSLFSLPYGSCEVSELELGDIHEEIVISGLEVEETAARDPDVVLVVEEETNFGTQILQKSRLSVLLQHFLLAPQPKQTLRRVS